MPDILVKPRELQKIADELKFHATTVANAVEGVHEVFRASTLNAIFEGNRALSVKSRYASACAVMDAFDDLITQFAIELREISNRFEIADRGKKKIIYLINGINYSGDPQHMDDFADSLEEKYGVEVRVVKDHPYDTRLIKGDIETRLGDWKVPLIGGIINSNTDMKNSIYGVLQVLDEYRSGGGNESKKVFEWIQRDLSEGGLLNNEDVDVVLFGHSGGGAIAANIVDDIEGLGVNVSGMVTAGSPVSNYDHALQYADKIYDVQHKDDNLGKLFVDWWLGSGGSIRSDEARALVPEDGASVAQMWDVTRRDNDWEDQSANITDVTIYDGTDSSDAHGSYYDSQELVNYFETILWGES